MYRRPDGGPPLTANAIALFASARRNGNTGAFMDRIAAELGIEIVDLAGLDIAPCDYEHRHRGDDFEPLMRRVLGFDRIIFASPVYWYAVSPPMKAFLDTFAYLGMHFGGIAHANCQDGFDPFTHEAVALEFVRSVRK